MWDTLSRCPNRRDTVINAITGEVSPLDLAAALAALGVPAERQERVHRAHSEHARLRRREHELGTLFSSARELAEVRDTEQLLHRLVRRAHEVLGCDVTYLSEFDQETRELHVRTTIGTYTPEFRQLRVPAGRGLASEIAETRTASWVARYSEYLADRHEAGIDRAVELEGIISILGVPMLSGDDVLGVLFVATREERAFAPEQVALLSALADHASSDSPTRPEHGCGSSTRRTACSSARTYGSPPDPVTPRLRRGEPQWTCQIGGSRSA